MTDTSPERRGQRTLEKTALFRLCRLGLKLETWRGGPQDVEWAMEADGSAPDSEVMNTPKEVATGRDPQLEAAVAEALRLLETEGVELMAEPAAPVRYRRPGGR